LTANTKLRDGLSESGERTPGSKINLSPPEGTVKSITPEGDVKLPM
jgi:hypothetical protein